MTEITLESEIDYKILHLINQINNSRKTVPDIAHLLKMDQQQIRNAISKLFSLNILEREKSEYTKKFHYFLNKRVIAKMSTWLYLKTDLPVNATEDMVKFSKIKICL